MKLVELAFPEGVNGDTRERAFALCQALGKVPVEVPDLPGFVVTACSSRTCSAPSSSRRRRASTPSRSTSA